jgi:hypothetical protein
MQAFLIIAYVVIGFAQLFAIMAGLEYALGLNWFFAGVLVLLVTYVPLIGSIAGVYGAVNVWNWGLLQAIALFFWYVPVAILVYAVGGIASLFDRR